MLAGMFARRAAAGGGGGSAFAATLLALGPYVYYKLDEAGGAPTTAADSSGNGRHGTYVNPDPASEAPGLFAGSTASRPFNNSAYIKVPTASIPAGSPFSVVIMAKSSTVGWNMAAGADSGADPGRLFRIGGDIDFGGRPQFAIPSNTTITGSSLLQDGNPHLLVGVFDGSLPAASGRLKLYMDGALQAQSTTEVSVSQTTLEMAVGAMGYGGGRTWPDGQLDEFAFFTTAISASDVAALWANRNG